MNEERNPSPKKGRVLGRQLPKILQGGGPVMIFGAKGPTSVNENAPSSNPGNSAGETQAEDGSGSSTNDVGQE